MNYLASALDSADGASKPIPDSKKFWGMFNRRERWGLSWRGRVVMASVVLLAGWGLVLGIHPFLAVTHRTNAKVLVVEGWIHGYGVDAAVQEFKTGHYERVLTTGGPVEGIGTSSSILYDTEAETQSGLAF
jgi:hypothetical protein